jgi:trans-2,3-dihydro-3-hydroxyanthranilate isomerase
MGNLREKKFYVVNSFGKESFQGNPAAVFFDTDDLSVEEMQAAAKQMNLVESVFVTKSKDIKEYDFQLRYFTPEKELPLAGHPTIAAFIALNSEGYLDLGNKDNYKIKTEKGLQEVYVHKKEDEVVVMLKTSTPVFGSVINDKDKVADILSINKEDISDELPMRTVDTGFGLLIVPVKSLDTLMNIKRNIQPLKEFCNSLNVNEVQAFSFETYNKQHTLHTRNICPREGIEDPGCGVGNAALGAYLLKNKYCEQSELNISAEQGVIVNMPCFIETHSFRENDNIQVEVGGTGKIMIKGSLFLE